MSTFFFLFSISVLAQLPTTPHFLSKKRARSLSSPHPRKAQGSLFRNSLERGTRSRNRARAWWSSRRPHMMASTTGHHHSMELSASAAAASKGIVVDFINSNDENCLAPLDAKVGPSAPFFPEARRYVVYKILRRVLVWDWKSWRGRKGAAGGGASKQASKQARSSSSSSFIRFVRRTTRFETISLERKDSLLLLFSLFKSFRLR